MRATYLWLSRIITLLVVVQAMAIAFAFFGVHKWIEDGNTLNKSAIESHDTHFTGDLGFMVHGLVGERVMPLLAILLLIVSFFAKVPKGIGIAVALVVLVVAQVAVTKFDMPYLGLVHGLGAFMIFGAAMGGAMQAKMASAATPAA